MPFDWNAEIEKLKRWLDSGGVVNAQQRIAVLAVRRDLKREFARPLASAARRAFLPNLTIRILARYVRPTGRKTAVPTDLELAEYGAALAELGATREALEVFSKADAEKFPDVLTLLEALVRGNRDLLLKLYFGSPYPGLRRRLVEALGGEKSIPGSFDWFLGTQVGKTGARSAEIDVISGGSNVSDLRLKTGQLPQRLFFALGTDGFRGYRASELFDRVFPDEHYNPVTSPQKLYQGIGRLRQWFHETGLPLTLDCVDGFYRLAAERPCVLKLTRIEEVAPPKAAILTNHLLSKLVEGLSKRPDSAKAISTGQAAKLFDVSERSAGRHLKAACDQGIVEKIGHGKKTRYRLKAS